MDKESAKQAVQVLVEKYDKVVSEGRDSKYKEEETKKDFIIPLFRALGWDVENSSEVTAEEKVSKKRVDYGFRINGIPKFFLEAKSFKEELDTRKYIDQAINYSWHKACTWAVLTNFESVKIFNAELKTEHPWQSQLKVIHCREFLQRFDELWLLSRESFEQGLIDKEAEKWGKKTKKSPVDKQLLADFTRFRELLSKNITKLNQSLNLTEEELDESIQRILDRLIFIRTCEDRELEAKTLISNLREWESKGRGQLIKSLRGVFAYFDKYNSRIFVNHLSDRLEIDNDVLHEIIEGLYHTKDNSVFYDFSAIDADVLGTIYEQYLSHILKKTEKRAKLTQNNAHRKEQGIYYTPPYIVDYIVRNSLGEPLKNKRINVETIKILDPACGSGSFLIKAFDVLNEYYHKNDKDYDQTQLDLNTGLTFTRKVKILQDNIFGVDLDKQAVEIAQLNLLLKITEKEQSLPLLEQNIKNGNSLIEDERLAGDKAFNWKEEFKQIMEVGGFDVVIGNPPYFNIKSDSELRYLSDFRFLSKGVVNSSALFVKRAIDLLKPNGYLGFIIPKSFAYVDSWKPLRDFLYDNAQFVKIVDVSKAFADVLLEQVIIIVKKQKPKKSELVEVVSDFNSPNQNIYHVEYGQFISNNTIVFSSNIDEKKLFEKICKNSVMLGEISENFRGIGAQRVVSAYVSGSERILSGKEIQRYLINNYHNYFISRENLNAFKKVDKLRQPKIMCQNIVAHVRNHIKITGAYDATGILNLDTVNNIVITNSRFLPKYILGLLNSKLISYFTYNFIYSKAIRTMHFDGNYSGKIPIKDIPTESQRDFEAIVDRLLSLNSRLTKIGAKETDDVKKIRNDIAELVKDLDFKIYELYDLETGEITAIEKSYE